MKETRHSPDSTTSASPEVIVDLSHPDVAGDAEKDDIAQRAYEIYEERGRADGADVSDWLQAERELRQLKVRPNQ